jgi:hypothetical protein
MEVYGIGFHEIALLRLNLEMEANAEVGAWPKVGKAGRGSTTDP